MTPGLGGAGGSDYRRARGVSEGEGTVLYLDCGGGYTNLRRTVYPIMPMSTS